MRDVTLATGEGVLRIMGDRHYATDVLAGAAIGFGFGFGVPTLLHYHGGGYADTLAVSPLMGGGSIGVLTSGRF